MSLRAASRRYTPMLADNSRFYGGAKFIPSTPTTAWTKLGTQWYQFGVPPAVVSGGVHTSDASYDYYTFTTSADLTCATAGFADILMVAGGGGGGCWHGAGGGAGGLVYRSGFILTPTDVYGIVIGGGGGGGHDGAGASGGNTTFVDLPDAIGGGGGGPGRELLMVIPEAVAEVVGEQDQPLVQEAN